MDRLGLLNSDASADDAVLETDIMRFMAIIGIVFWIIFSIVKTMPLTEKRAGPGEAIAPEKIMASSMPAQTKPAPILKTIPKKTAGPVEKAVKPQVPAIARKPVRQAVPQASQKKAPMPAASAKPKKPERKTAPAGMRGLSLEFKSLNAVMELVRHKKIEIYCRAKATGFDLFFKGIVMKSGISFRSSDSIPQQLWEIKDGEAHAYFLDKIAGAYPAIRNFFEKQVLISFIDKKLEKTVMSRLEQLNKEHKNGILSITGDAKIRFLESLPANSGKGTSS